jgi:RHS repeat-associated protein
VTEAVKRMQYNANGRLTRVTATDGTQTSFSYDAQSHLTSITNAAGDVTRCTYDASGNLSRIIDPQNNSTSFEYDEYGYRTAKENRDASNALLSRETYVHDGLGRVTETRTAILINGISQGESVMKHSYDANGRLLSTTAADGGVSSTEYDAAGLAVKSTDALGHVSTTEWDASGRVARHVSASGLVSTTNYDAEGRITTVTTSSGSLPPQAANSRVTRTEYDALGRPIATIDALGKISRSEYDALGRLTATVDATGLRTERIYDPASGSSRLLEVRAPGGTLKYGYDIAGRQVSVTDALGRVTLTEFDGAGRPVATVFPDGSRSKFEYDNLGRQIAMTDEMNHRTEFAYDGAGRLLQVTDALQGSTKFAYDSRGLKLTQIDANQHCTSFRYDANGRRVARILPAGQTETYAYNAGNQLVRHSDFNGKTTSYQYDAEGRLVEKAAAPNHPSLSLAHAASKITYAFDVFGQAVSSVVWHGGQVLHQTSYTFDANGQMSQRATDEGLIDYSYDAAGRLLSAKSDHASGHELSYVYDTAGRLSTVNAVDATGHTRRASYSYDAVGNLASQKHGAITQTFSFDTRNRLTELNATVSGLSFSYTLNLAGRRTQSLENGQIFNFDYDALHRLISEAQNGGGLAQYSLDAVGNRTGVQSTLSGVDSKTYSYDANDRVIGDTYDANGNTLSSTQGSDTYDFDNRLIRRVTGSGKVIDLFYDADGQRVAKRVNDLETRYLLDTQNPTGYAQCVEELQVVDSLRSVVHRSYFGLQLFAEEKITWTGDIPSSDLRFTHQDGHGSVRALSNSSGDLTESLTYDAFGILRNKTGNFDLHHGYTSEFYDADLGLYYLRARWYRPELGRFWTMDRHEGSGEDPLSLHKYLYANAEPVNNRDPSGQFSILEMLASSGFANSIGNMYNGSVFGVGNGMIASVMGVMAGKTMNEVAIGFVLDETGIGLVIDLAKYVSDLVMRMCNNAALAAEAEFSVLMQYYVVPWFVAIDESNDNAAGAQEYLDGLFEPIPGPQCFNAGTPIATSAGSKPVEKISKNDQVWSWDDKVQKKVLKPVLQTFTLQRDIGCDLTVDGEVLHTTPEHPFYLADRTWRAAAHLLPGDRLFDPSNSKGKRVDEVKVLASHRQVYNFEVEGLHNYFVGEKWVLVHNVGGHHHFFQNAFVKGLGLRSIQYGPKFLGPARKLSSATHEATHRMLNDYLRAKGMCPQGGKNSIKAADLCKGKSIQDIVDLHRDFYVKHGNSIPGMAPGKALELFDGEVIQIIRLNSH